MSQETNLAADLWALADLLRGDFRQSQYGRVILPFALLRRLECVLESSKSAVLAEVAKVEKMAIAEEAKEKLLLRATSGLSFFNTSPMDLSTLGESGIKANLERYIQCFSKDAREIFDHFKFAEFIGLLNDANLLYKVVQKVRTMDLHPKAVSNYEMGLVFEELIRKFAESSNDTAGEHFTPRDIVRLTTSLVFMEDDEALLRTFQCLRLNLRHFVEKESFVNNGIHPPNRIFYSLSMAFCTKSAVRSIDVLNNVFDHLENSETEDPEEDIDVQSVLDELQNLIVQGAAVARYFWPIRETQQIHASRALALRNEFSIGDDNPLRICKPLRDAMEHFDERLDKYLSKGIVGQIFPQYFGFEVKRDGVPQHFFRAYFTDSGTFEMLGERFEIEPIATELIRLNNRLGEI